MKKKKKKRILMFRAQEGGATHYFMNAPKGFFRPSPVIEKYN